MNSATTVTKLQIDPVRNKFERTREARGGLAEQLLTQFPARPLLVPQLTGDLAIEEVVELVERPPFRPAVEGTRFRRRFAIRLLLRWLAIFPGQSWQERWLASGAEADLKNWTRTAAETVSEQVKGNPRPADFTGGLMVLTVARVVCPSPRFLLSLGHTRNWTLYTAECRDPSGFEFLWENTDAEIWKRSNSYLARWQITIIVLTKGGGIRDITVGDCVELRKLEPGLELNQPHRYLFYNILHSVGVFPSGAPTTIDAIEKFGGQRSCEALVDRYHLDNRDVRDLLVDYLAERQAALDYSTLQDLARSLAMHFWKNLEVHHPGIDSLNLAPDVARAWKDRLSTKTTQKHMPDGKTVEITSPRSSYHSVLTCIRAFYLDIAQWAAEDPGRWARWVAPCPINSSEAVYRKVTSRRKAKMDQRTRDRIPLIPTLVQTAERRMEEARLRLEAALATGTSETFTVLGETFTRTMAPFAGRTFRRTIGVCDSSGQQRHLPAEERRAFWAWAAVEFLRHTGVRIEEMLEVSHHSIIQYRHPDTQQIVPLLHIAPSKTDEERLLVISPELADVLSTIIARVRQDDGTVPLVPFYDAAERVWTAPAPLLFQWFHNSQNKAISGSTIRLAIKEIFAEADLKDSEGQPLYFQPHDLRRIFATEAILNGMPPHIAQLLLGHKDLSTTMGYKAVYPQEAINGHRAFIARRRALRPSEEYRTPTDAEWEEFLGHFERRKVALGECGRAYGTSCQHEHSCIRCPVLRVDPEQRRRLEQIRDNLTLRIAEAQQEGWLGEAEGLQVSLDATHEKLAQLDERTRRAATVFLEVPSFPDVAGHTISVPELTAPRR